MPPATPSYAHQLRNSGIALRGSPRPHPWQHIQPDIGPEPDACRLQELQWPTQISISTIGRRLVSRLGRRGPAGTGTTTPLIVTERHLTGLPGSPVGAAP